MGALSMPTSLSIFLPVVSLCVVFSSELAHAETLTEDSCSAIATRAGEKPVMRDVPGLSILNRRPDEPLVLVGVDGVTINGIVCWRSEARLAENDYVPLEAGFSLYIKTDRENDADSRTLVLEMAGGSFRARLLSGPALTDAEKMDIQRFLSAYEARHREKLAGHEETAGSEASQSGRLSPNAPKDQSFRIDDPGGFDAAITPYVAKARETYPAARDRFLKGLPRGHTFFVVTRIYDSEARWEQVYIRVQTIRDGLITGVISTQLKLVKGYEPGRLYSLKEAALVDWVIARPDGTEEGNVVGKFLDSRGR